MALKPCRECKREVSTGAKACPHCGAASPTASIPPISAGIGCLVILIVIYAIVQLQPSSRTASSPPAAPEPPRVDPTALAIANLKLDYSWGTEADGSIMIANFTVTNNGDRTVKDLEILCTHYSASKTAIDENRRTIYELFPAKKKRVIRDFNMGFIHSQAKSSRCEIKSLAFP